jgi:anti-sigma regulatory factor (Ser/Thr protein kinase)
VRHARGTPNDVSVRVDGKVLRADVSDGGAGFAPPAADHNPLKSAGWGLFLVRRIATRWGSEPESGTVWFELEQGGSR